MPGSYVIPCWCLGETERLVWRLEAARWEQERRRKGMDNKRVLIGSGVNEALAREAEAADRAEAEEARQRAVDLALSEEDPRPAQARRR